MVIHEHLIQPRRQQTTNVVQFSITRNSRVTFYPVLLGHKLWATTWAGINIWYIGAPLGKNEIGKLMKTAAQSAGLQGNFNNHTVRKTCISRLMDAEVPVDNVPQLSGHRHLKSLDSYKAASADNQWKMSLILSRSGQESTQTSTISVHENTTLPANLPKDVSKSGVFSGACIGNVEGCTFTFNIAREKEESPKSAKPKKRRIIISYDSNSD